MVRGMMIRDYLQRLTVGDDEARLLTMEESGLPVDMLVTTLYGFGSVSNIGQGEFYFYGEEEPEAFACRITVVPEVLAENVLPLCVELATVNYDLPIGSFSFDRTENCVVYTLQVPFAESLSDEEIIEEADLCIRLAIDFSARYASQYAFYANRREL